MIRTANPPVGRWRVVATFGSMELASAAAQYCTGAVLIRDHGRPNHPCHVLYELVGRNDGYGRPATNPAGAVVPPGSRAESQEADAR